MKSNTTHSDQYDGVLWRTYVHRVIGSVQGAPMTIQPDILSQYYIANGVLHGEGGMVDQEKKSIEQLDDAAYSVVQCDLDASAFVELTVGPITDNGIYAIPEHDTESYAGYATFLGLVATRAIRQLSGDDIDKLETTVHLVHERAHNTGCRNGKVIVVSRESINERGETKLTNYSATSFGHQIVKITLHGSEQGYPFELRNQFLEEAFAELTAVRYRVFETGVSDETLIEFYDSGNRKRKLPKKYVHHCSESSARVTDSAIPAYTIELISMHTGIDIYDLMILARDPAYEVEAKRAIVKAIESVEKGLYKIIRDTPDKLSAFVKTHHIVLDALNRAKVKDQQA